MAIKSIKNVPITVEGNKFDALNIVCDLPPIKNLVFEGGGVKGLVYLGVIKKLSEVGIIDNIKNVAGSSAGAITALALSLGYTTDQLEDKLNNLDMLKLLDWQENAIKWSVEGAIDALRTGSINLLSIGISILKKTVISVATPGGGLTKGKKLEDWLKNDLIKPRLMEINQQQDLSVIQRSKITEILSSEGLTFSQLNALIEYFPSFRFKDLIVTGTNITNESLDLFSHFSTPNMQVSLAVRASASFPKVFECVEYNGKKYIDGGCLLNYPMSIFDQPPYRNCEANESGIYGQNLTTLGFKVDTAKECSELLWQTIEEEEDNNGLLASAMKKLYNLGGYIATSLVGADFKTADIAAAKELYEKYSLRSVQINDLAISTLKFNLTNEEKRALRDQGYTTTSDWLKLYIDNAAYHFNILTIDDLDSLPVNDLMTCLLNEDMFSELTEFIKKNGLIFI